MKHLKRFDEPLNESAATHGEFTEGFVRSLEKYMPKDRWTFKFVPDEHAPIEIEVTNDFDETAVYRLTTYKSSAGEKRFNG